MESLNRVPASSGVKAGTTSVGWQVTLRDPSIWHVSSRSGVAGSTANCSYIRILYFLLYSSSRIVARKRSSVQFSSSAVHAALVVLVTTCQNSRQPTL